MLNASSQSPPESSPGRRSHLFLVAAGLVLAALLAISSLLGDSINFDETADLTAGMSHLVTGDFRLSPAHPPLSKMWAALPLLLTDQRWVPPQTPGWGEGQTFQVGRTWLCRLNDGERLMAIARGMVVALLLATCLCIYVMARSLFGPGAGLLALTLAVLSPTLLAHGRLVTTDLPLTLCAAITLLAFARLLRQVTWARLVCAGLSIGAMSLVKFSWLLILPALVLMAGVAVFRDTPMPVSLRPPAASSRGGPVYLQRRSARAATVVAIGVFMAAFVWVSIWTCYGWRYSPFRGPDRGRALMMPAGRADQPLPTTMDGAWESVLHDVDGKPLRGGLVRAVLWARHHRLLPEAYLYGLAYTKRTTATRPAYLNGAISYQGWTAYFPIAFAAKTPLATLLLLAAGLIAIFKGQVSTGREPILLAGLAAFALVYAAFAVTSHVNIGQRHILPLYPAVMIFAGASAAWLDRRPARWLVGAAVLWLAGTNLYIHPHYLSYFNELAGGPAQGHRLLADSNLDWGQDLKRLARYARRHPDQTIKLAYFGSSDPTCYGFPCEMLPSYLPNQAHPAELGPGTYVISVTQLLGLYQPTASRAFWENSRNRETYRKQYHAFVGRGAETAPAEQTPDSQATHARFELLRRGRLLSRLRNRSPDERIGYSLFVYRLTQADLDILTAP